MPQNVIVKLGDPFTVNSQISTSTKTEWHVNGPKVSVKSTVNGVGTGLGYYLTGDSANEEYNLNVNSAVLGNGGTHVSRIHDHANEPMHHYYFSAEVIIVGEYNLFQFQFIQ